jgi:hypothetical protein
METAATELGGLIYNRQFKSPVQTLSGNKDAGPSEAGHS